jgi:hypothetical protein
MNERQKTWAVRAKKLLRQLEMREAPRGKYRRSLAALEEEIATVEDLIRSYWELFANVSLSLPGDVGPVSSTVPEARNVPQKSHGYPPFTGSTSDWRQSDPIH